MPATAETAFCSSFHRAIELVGRRWTGAIIRAMLDADCASRFGELTSVIPGLSDRMLSERLKELEAEGIVARSVVPETPVRVEYRLTEKGLALASAIETIGDWAERWVAPEAGARARRRRGAPAPRRRTAARSRA